VRRCRIEPGQVGCHWPALPTSHWLVRILFKYMNREGTLSIDYVHIYEIHYHESKRAVFIDAAAIGSFVIVLNKGQNDITVNVKEALNINMDKSSKPLAKGSYGQV
jgi:hypothetical protein